MPISDDTNSCILIENSWSHIKMSHSSAKEWVLNKFYNRKLETKHLST